LYVRERSNKRRKGEQRNYNANSYRSVLRRRRHQWHRDRKIVICGGHILASVRFQHWGAAPSGDGLPAQ